MQKFDWCQNTQKLRRIIDKNPTFTEEQLKEEYVNNGGLLNKEETIERTFVEDKGFSDEIVKEIKKAVKKVTKKK